MLTDFKVNAMVATTDLARARAFYEDTVGLLPEVLGDAVRYDCADRTWFLLYRSPVQQPAPQTIANWMVDDLAATVEELQQRGVTFVSYEGRHGGRWRDRHQ